MQTTNELRAAIYARSSKDRSDISIDAQRDELQRLADARGYLICQEFSDVVESGKDDDRPGFQSVIAAIRSPSRGWTHLLLLDTARLARRQYIGVIFEHDAEKHGVTVVYKTVPETDPITAMLLKSILRGIDEWLSLTSRQKGLAGMAQNIKKGFRAGGRAPKGYRLRYTKTGAVRDGEDVKKSTLEPNEDAPLAARYLKARAAGEKRKALIKRLSLAWPQSTLINMEKNALVYAGHTVWNVHREFVAGQGYKGGIKRRPRSEWTITENTHPALITVPEAEALLAQMETSRGRGFGRGESADYLLSGLLRSPIGVAWHGDGGQTYRLRTGGAATTIDAHAVESAVLTQMRADISSPTFVAALLAETRRIAGERGKADPAADLRTQHRTLTARISRAMDLAGDLADPQPALRKIDELERQRKQLLEEIDRIQREQAVTEALAGITAESITAILDNVFGQMADLPRADLRALLASMVERVTLDPKTRQCRIHYRISVGDQMASPRGSALVPVIRHVSAAIAVRRSQ